MSMSITAPPRAHIHPRPGGPCLPKSSNVLLSIFVRMVLRQGPTARKEQHNERS
jgi:hypothetical protein